MWQEVGLSYHHVSPSLGFHTDQKKGIFQLEGLKDHAVQSSCALAWGREITEVRDSPKVTRLVRDQARGQSCPHPTTAPLPLHPQGGGKLSQLLISVMNIPEAIQYN